MNFILFHINQLEYYIKRDLKKKTIKPDIEKKLQQLLHIVDEMKNVCNE